MLLDLRQGLALALAFFQLASELSEEVEITFGGKLHVFSKKPGPGFLTATDFQPWVMVADILREKSARHILERCFEKLELSGNTIAASKFLQFLVHGTSNTVDLKYFNAFKGSQSGTDSHSQHLIFPLVNVWQQIFECNASGFQVGLREALLLHNKFWSTEDKKALQGGWISLPLLHACAYAHDHGMEIEVESDYLPRWLYMGEGIK